MAGGDHGVPALPLGCSLQGGDATERVAAWRELLAAALIDRGTTPGGVRLRLARRPEVEQRLRELVELERECCSAVAFRIAVEGEALALEMEGNPDAAPSVRAVFAAGPPSRRR